MRKIHSIDSTGKIKFVGSKGEAIDGTEEDCKAYGYKYANKICRIPSAKQEVSKADNFINGNNNVVNGISNSVLGNSNTLRASNSVAIGKGHYMDRNSMYATTIGLNSYAENFGELSYSSSVIKNRAKFSILQYDATTTDGVETEIYLGGHEGARLYINTDYESGYAIDYTVVALNEASNEVWTNYGHATYKYVNNTLTEVGHQKGTTIRDSALDYDINFSAHTHDADHISVDVTGETGHTAYWTVILRVTEVRYG